MPVPILCSRCGRAGEVPDHYVGANVRCPKCRAVIAVAGAVAGEFAFDEPSSDGPANAGGAGGLSLEPWYYGYCHLVTLVLLVLNLAGFALMVLVFVLGVVLGGANAVAKGEKSVLPAVLVLSFSQLVAVVAALLLSLYGFSFVLIFIDAARHVRRIHESLGGQVKRR